MGFFDKFKKKEDEASEAKEILNEKRTTEEKRTENEAERTDNKAERIENKADNGSKGKEESEFELNTSGWDAITEVFENIYPGQKNPMHYGTLISWQLGGNDPLDGISIYDGGDYWHFVTYGLSEIYEKEFEDKEYSGYGMEFTLKLKKLNNEKEEAEIRGMCGILQSIARITYTEGELFYPNEYIYTGQTMGMDVEQLSKITGFITAEDEQAGSIDTPNGKVTFIELIGATDKELKMIMEKELKVKELYSKISNSLTDYNREDCI
ncbi:suppressor of fused domain protein [Anaerocolumna sp. AGMB13020]|uniref:suppressor of fused domain protein n=1 Tax=Anaerocolumna sp. AGMB13020 TaxID=3081750 RepID=UPI0029555EA8|nr:suppressor of fused domain protein [Anaerocolumna sp. AGMB13020]WOO37686.1 suppressor of fused domain protein [Anaerocolumna sp. AGMB13020]